MIEDIENGVIVTAYTQKPSWAEIDVVTYPDGSPKHMLEPDDLRLVADMINQFADRMENE